MINRFYTTTPVIALAIGRRRRQQNSGGLGGGDDESTTKTDSISSNNNKSVNVKIEPKVFLSHVAALFDTVHQAMIPLIPINDVMILTRGESSREMHEEQERRDQEERKRVRKEMKDKNEKDVESSGAGSDQRKQNGDDEREPVSVQSMSDLRIIDGPYLKIELGPIHGQYTFVADVEIGRASCRERV